MKNVAKEKENARSFEDVLKESVNISNEDNEIQELQMKEINKEVVQKKKYKMKSTLALNQSRKKNRKYVNVLKNCNPQRYANVFAESDEGRKRFEKAKKNKENSCSFQMNKDEKVTQVAEADWPSREIARCKKCDNNMYNCRNSEVQCNFVNIDEYVNDRLQQQLLEMKTCDTSAYKFEEKKKHCKYCKCSKAKTGNSANYIQKNLVTHSH